MRRLTILIPVVLVALVALLSSIFIVDEREKALVLQFGQIQRVKEEPGLAFKIPFIQEVVRYDDRILENIRKRIPEAYALDIDLWPGHGTAFTAIFIPE